MMKLIAANPKRKWTEKKQKIYKTKKMFQRDLLVITRSIKREKNITKEINGPFCEL